MDCRFKLNMFYLMSGPTLTTTLNNTGTPMTTTALTPLRDSDDDGFTLRLDRGYNSRTKPISKYAYCILTLFLKVI